MNADGSFTYTHDGSEMMSDALTYQVSDGSTLSNVAIFAMCGGADWERF